MVTCLWTSKYFFFISLSLSTSWHSPCDYVVTKGFLCDRENRWRRICYTVWLKLQYSQHMHFYSDDILRQKWLCIVDYYLLVIVHRGKIDLTIHNWSQQNYFCYVCQTTTQYTSFNFYTFLWCKKLNVCFIF